MEKNLCLLVFFVFGALTALPVRTLAARPGDCDPQDLARLTRMVKASSIPRLPRLDELRARVLKGAPTERLRRLPESDPFSSSQILLEGSGASLMFSNVLKALEKANITKGNLEPSERDYLLDAVMLHSAIKLKQGNFRDLDGIDEMLRFLDVEEFRLADEYLDVVRFWLEKFPESFFYQSTFTRFGGDDGEIDFSGSYVRRREKANRKQQQELAWQWTVEDYRLGLEKNSTVPLELTPEVMNDFMDVHQVLMAIRNYERNNRGKSLTNTRSLGALVRALADDRR